MRGVTTIEACSLLGILVHIRLNHGLDKWLDVEVVLGGGRFSLAKFVHVTHAATLAAFPARVDGVVIVA